MAGAFTAAPIDPAGALYWNPAGISGLAGNHMALGVELLLPTETLTSSVPGFGQGTTRGEPGVSAIPMMAWSHHVQDTPWTVGLGVFGVGGYRVDYASSTTNPVLTPPPPVGGGLGALKADLEVLQIVPTISLAVSDQLAIGFAPVLGLGRLGVSPLLLAPPNLPENPLAPPQYRDGLANRYHFGGGFQLGVYYIVNDLWRLGASFKSPTWFEDFRFRNQDTWGLPNVDRVDIDYPMMFSVGSSLKPDDRWLIALDVRYLDYRNTDGFRTAAFQSDGSLSGLGWTSTIGVSLGVQYKVNNGLQVRAGYGYQENPIGNQRSGYNLLSPLIVQHLASVGCSFKLADRVDLNVAYIHGFKASVDGPIITPLGPIPGSSVSSDVSADALGVGISVCY